jgi:heterodisulfide reductase subunit B
MIHGIIEAAYDNGVDMTVTPCPLCQTNVEIYQDEINKKFGSKFEMPVVYYSQLISVAYGRFIEDSALDGRIIKAKNWRRLLRNKNYKGS